ncbi:MAG TPA: AmpG family muropeptide MFS transporter, partial [Aeromonas sp.]|nr:AmpG family muropeptide MFS transporter [Aeromonas sp.]
LSPRKATSAVVHYLLSRTIVALSPSQYALFCAKMVLMTNLLGCFAGHVLEQIGYSSFFVGTSQRGIAVLILIIMVAKRGDALLPQADK